MQRRRLVRVERLRWLHQPRSTCCARKQDIRQARLMPSKDAQEAGIVDQAKRTLASSFLQGSREECEPRLDSTRTPLPGTRRSAPG